MKVRLTVLFTAIVGFLSFVPYVGYWFSLFAVVPLLYCVYHVDTVKQAMKWSYLCGVAYFVVNVYWIYRFSWIGLLLVILLFSLFWMAAGYLFFLLKHTRYFYFYVALTWTVLEFIRGFGPLRFPWAELGSAAPTFLPVANTASLWGMHGITFFTALIAAHVFKYMLSKRRSFLIRAIGIVLFLTVTGLVMMHTFTASEGKKVTAAAIQPSVSLYEKWDDAFITELMEIYKKLAFSVSSDTKLIVWPETAFAAGIFNYKTDSDAFKTITEHSGEAVYHLAATSYDTKDGNYNALALADNRGYYGIYAKIRLLPVAEYLPFQSLSDYLSRFYDINELTPGADYTIFEFEGIKFAGVICFESIFHDFFPTFIMRGAQFFAVSTNDGWFDDTLVPFQHLQFSRLRAIESGRDIVHCANSGISAFIDHKGRIRASLAAKERGVLESFLYTRDYRTVYYYIRDWWLAALLLIAVVLYRKETVCKK